MLGLLGSAIDDLLAVDPHGLSDGELHATVVELQRLSDKLSAARARLVTAWEVRRVWADDGSKSAAARLGRECRMAQRTARAELRRGRALRSMPATAAALAAGRISVDGADRLAVANQPEVADLFARDEELLVDQAQRLRFPDFVRAVTYWRHCADDHRADERAERQHDGRHFNAVRSFEDNVEVGGTLDPVDGGIFLTELERLEQDLFEADWAWARAEYGDRATADLLRRTPAQRRADALVEMARRSAALTGEYTPARPLVTVLVGYETFAGTISELADGTVITPSQIIPLLSDAEIERIVFDGPSRVIDVGARRLFTGALRRAIEVRDRHCVHPSGCVVPAHKCQVDHIVPYAAGGPTTQDNGRLLCPVHNRRRNQRPPPNGQAA